MGKRHGYPWGFPLAPRPLPLFEAQVAPYAVLSPPEPARAHPVRSWEVDLIHNAHDRRIHRRHFLADGVAGGSALEHDQHLFMDARTNAVHGQQLWTARRIFERQRLNEQQLCAFELAVFLGGNERTGNARDLHDAGLPDVPGIDDPHNAGVGGHLDWMKRKTRFFAAHEEHVFADAGAHGVGSHDDPADRLARRRHRLDEQQRHALQRLVLVVQHQRADDASQLHYSLNSISSTMPTMAASTGQSFNPAAMRAELPLTISTVSPKPASTVSIATT